MRLAMDRVALSTAFAAEALTYRSLASIYRANQESGPEEF
jgi:hypothetical protein